MEADTELDYAGAVLVLRSVWKFILKILTWHLGYVGQSCAMVGVKPDAKRLACFQILLGIFGTKGVFTSLSMLCHL